MGTPVEPHPPDQGSDALVIADAAAHYYVIPLDLVDQTRVPDEAKDRIDDAIGVDTMGFASLGFGFSLVGPLTAEQQRDQDLGIRPVDT